MKAEGVQPGPALARQINECAALAQRDPAKASQRVARLLKSNPRVAALHTLSAMLASNTGRRDRAVHHAQRAAELAPEDPETHAMLGTVHARGAEYDEARAHFDRALELDPAHAGALAGLGTALSQTGAFAQARRVLQTVHERNPKLPDALVNRALLELDTTHAARAIEILESAPDSLRAHPYVLDLLALAHTYDDTKTPEQVFGAHKRFGDELARHIEPIARHPNDPDPDRRLRVAYLSCDLRRHSIAYFLEPLLEHHDAGAFEIHALMTTPDLDAVSERMRAHVHKWHDASSLSNPQLTRLITDQRIDILVELTGHFVGHKLPVLAARPAPVQVSFIGYANTTGTDRIDARFVDEITDPPPRADALATETLVRLPHCFLCYRPDPDAPEPAEPDPDRPVTIGSFNNLAKLSDPTLGVWSRVLRERPDARLMLKATRLDHGELRDELLARFEELGVERERLDLRGSAPRFTDHLAMYDELDAALDSFPYNGTTTTCEALWMGVPTVTLIGETHAGRVGASLLTAAGLDDWITETQDDYAARALAAIDEGVRGRDQRLALRERVASSTLCDASSYAPRVESAYRALWKSWCASRGSAP